MPVSDMCCFRSVYILTTDIPSLSLSPLSSPQPVYLSFSIKVSESSLSSQSEGQNQLPAQGVYLCIS